MEFFKKIQNFFAAGGMSPSDQPFYQKNNQTGRDGHGQEAALPIGQNHSDQQACRRREG